MLKATLRRPCLQPASSCAGSGEISQYSYGLETPKVDPKEGYGCLVLQRKKGSGAICPFNLKEQEEKNELSAEKWREHIHPEGRNTNGDILVPKFNSYGLPSTGTSEPLRPAPELLHSGTSTRADPSQEWKLVKVKRVLISPASQPRKANLSRSASLSEKELKEAKARSQKIAAQLTNPPSSNSKGVLLFNRRKQRVNEFTLESPGKSGEEAATRGRPRALQGSIVNHGKLQSLKQTLEGSKELQILQGNMEEYEEDTCLEKTQSPPTNEVKREEILPKTRQVPSLKESPSGDVQQVPLTVYLKENIKVASTNGVHEPNANELEHAPVIDSEKNASILIKEQTTLVMEKEKNVPVIDKETTIPVTSKETTFLVTSKEMTVPVTREEATVPVTSKEVTFPVTSKEATVLVTGKEWTVPVISKEWTVPVTSKEATVPVTSKEATVLITSKEWTVPVTSEEATVLVTSKEWTVPVTSKEATVPVTSKEATVPVTSKEVTVPVISKEWTVPVTSKEWTVPITSKEATVPVTSKEATVPVTSEEATVPVTSKAWTVPVTSKAWTVPLTSEEATVPVTSEEATVPVTSEEATVPVTSKEWNGVSNKQYYEVHLTLAKPMPVKNRTARPFGTQSSVTIHPTEKSPGVEIPPPPTYAETLGSPPPVTRVRSPPAYSALYPSAEQKSPVLIRRSSGESKSAPLHKTGMLKESIARRGGKKSMFTFVEKPKMAPNPDLLNLVQNADIRRKRKEQGEPVPEDEPFALGAEASNFLHQSALDSADDAPEWSSCLKSPSIQPKLQVKPSQNLTEAKGKGAELFARRQSRMEKYVIESPAHPGLARSPSPTMSLPPSWKYVSNTPITPVVFKQPTKSPARSSKTPPASLYNSTVMETQISRKELNVAKQQPHQLQSSLFIPSPAKETRRALPTGPPAPQPVFPNSHSYAKHASCPTSPLPPSPGLYSPALSGSSRPTSGPFSPSTGTVPFAQDTRTSAGASSEALFASPSRVLSPRAKGVFLAPRPSYSTRNAGIEPQERRVSLPASMTWTPRLVSHPSPFDGWTRSESEEGPSMRTPPPPMSPSWSERSLSPPQLEADPKASRQMQARLARNIINAARRKSLSPKAVGPEGIRPFTPPIAGAPPASTSLLDNLSPSPQSPRATQVGGHRQPSTGTPQFNISPGVSPRIPSSPSPTYISPLQSPRTTRAAGHRYFTLPTNIKASSLNVAAGSSPGATSCLSPTYRSPGPAPMSTWTEGHRILTLPTSAGVLPANVSSCASPQSPGTYSSTFMHPVQSPTEGARSPVKRYTSRSSTDSDLSIDSEESGLKSPSIRSFNICPRGWNGAMRLRQVSLPSEAPCTS
uniref:Synaptopodin n=1 Tax=Pelusios castaneus TaxID=367368 RepID=A0A8C8SUA6_9SAUR